MTEGQSKILKTKISSVTRYTNTLLRMVYKGDELAKCSLTGKSSNAFKKTTKVAKPKLPNVENIIGKFCCMIY